MSGRPARLVEPPELEPPALALPVEPSYTAAELVALALLSLGALVAPIVGPVIGLVLLWRSRGWRRSEKGVATALVMLPVVLAAGAVGVVWFLRLWRFS